MSYKQNDRNEYCAAVATIALISMVCIYITIYAIFELWKLC
jgi:hypothetical protein